MDQKPKIILLVVIFILFEFAFFTVGVHLATGPPIENYVLPKSGRQIKVPASRVDVFHENVFEAQVTEGTIYENKIDLKVRQTSKTYSGTWIDWRAVVNASYIVTQHGTRIAADEGTSYGWTNGEVKGGEYREGIISFRTRLEDSASSFDLHFAYVPNIREIKITVPVNRE